MTSQYLYRGDPVRVDPMVRMIVGRRHVGESYRQVIRYVASRLKGGMPAFWRASREQRRLLMQMTVMAHRENRDMYAMVMGGSRS